MIRRGGGRTRGVVVGHLVHLVGEVDQTHPCTDKDRGLSIQEIEVILEGLKRAVAFL